MRSLGFIASSFGAPPECWAQTPRFSAAEFWLRQAPAAEFAPRLLSFNADGGGRAAPLARGLDVMTATIGTLVASHAAGKALTATIEETYARIESHNDPALFIAIRPKPEAVAIAERVQAAGPEGKPLYGVPFVVKDNIDVAGLPTTAACPAFAYRPGKSAFVVERLERAGAIVIGKTNLDQFATGLVGVRSPYGIPRNALRADLIPGGSSSGSATAVGAGLVPFSLGTDTAGSGRIPAAFNGIAGLKPSLGALSASGVVPACRTLDTVSVFARDVVDAFAVFQAASAFDEQDAYARPFPPPALSALPGGIRLGVPRADQRLFFDDKDAAAAFSQDLRLAESLGARIVEFDFEPFAEVARALYEGPWVAERYAAVKSLIESNPEALHPVTRAIIEGARKFDAVAAFEAFYRLADQKRRTSRVWSEFEAMLVPTMPRPYTIAEVEADPVRLNSRLGTYTNFVNLLDLCAIAVPSHSPRRRIAGERDPHCARRRRRPHRRRRRGHSGAFRRIGPRRRRQPKRGPRVIGSRSRSWARISRGCRSIASSSSSAQLSRAKSKPRRTIACSRCPALPRPNRDCCEWARAPAPASRLRYGRSTRRASALLSPGSPRRSESEQSGSRTAAR